MPGIITYGFICAILTTQVIAPSPCKYQLEKGLEAAHCEESERRGMPSDTELKSKTEVLYLSKNYLKKLDENSFSKLTSLKYLYLDRNNIVEIKPRTFASLTSLHTLDISHAVVNYSTLQLPASLNTLIHNDMGIPVDSMPITYLQNLEVLQMEYCQLQRLPQFNGFFTNLKTLDILENPLNRFKIDDLASFCSLKTLVMSVDWEPNDPCECNKLNKWAKERNIRVDAYKIVDKSISPTNLLCVRKENECNLEPSNEALSLYQSCVAERSQQQVYYWLKITGCISAVSFACIVLCLLYRKRKSLCCNTKRMTTVKV